MGWTVILQWVRFARALVCRGRATALRCIDRWEFEFRQRMPGGSGIWPWYGMGLVAYVRLTTVELAHCCVPTMEDRNGGSQ